MKNFIKAVAISAALCGSLSAQTVLKPHFTEQSKKITIPKDGNVFPEIRNGIITVGNYPQVYFVNLKGEYVFGSNFPFTRGNDYRHSPYFSGGAMMGWRTKPNEYSNTPFIVYPDGKYRDLKDVSDASSFLDGYALVQKGKSVIMGVKQGFIDKNGKDVFPKLTSTAKGTMNDMTIYPLVEKRRIYFDAGPRKYGYADDKGNVAIKPTYEKAESFSEGLAAVMTDDQKWGFINATGKMVIPATYRLKPGRFKEGLAAVRIGDNESDYEMTYIDKNGKRMMEPKRWNLNEFNNGFALVGTGCEKMFVMDKEFKEVRDMTKDFHQNGNGFGTCSFSMLSGHVHNKSWGFDFPNGMRALNQNGVGEAGEIFAPDGTLLFTAVDAKNNKVFLNDVTEGGLILVQASFLNEPKLKEKDVFMQVFINQKGEVVYYFEKGVEGYEGGKNTLLK